MKKCISYSHCFTLAANKGEQLTCCLSFKQGLFLGLVSETGGWASTFRKCLLKKRYVKEVSARMSFSHSTSAQKCCSTASSLYKVSFTFLPALFSVFVFSLFHLSFFSVSRTHTSNNIPLFACNIPFSWKLLRNLTMEKDFNCVHSLKPCWNQKWPHL